MQGSWVEGLLPVREAVTCCRSPVDGAVQAEVVATLRQAEGSRRNLGKLLVMLRSCGAI